MTFGRQGSAQCYTTPADRGGGVVVSARGYLGLSPQHLGVPNAARSRSQATSILAAWNILLHSVVL